MDPVDPYAAPSEPARPAATPAPSPPGLWTLAGQATWIAGLVLALSSFMGWYSGDSAEGATLSVLGWNTGTLGKLVFVVGAIAVCLAILREVGVEMPRSFPESLIVVVLGTMGTVFVLIRVISIPDEFAGTANRAVGLWIGLIAAVALVASGLVRAAEEL